MQEKFSIPMSKPDITEDEIKAVTDVLESGWPTQGRVTEQFEALLANYFSSNIVVVNSGSSALLCALIAHGIRPGDKVVVPAFTFVASASIPKILGAEIIVADVDRSTFNADPKAVEAIVKRNNDVKAVVVVDVAGLPADIDAFRELSKHYGFVLIEDAAEALGAEYKSEKLGSFDHTTIFSFQIAKQLTTIEGGCVSTTNEGITTKCRQVRNYGRDENARYVHQLLGLNLRITDVQSAIGIVQFKKLEGYLHRRNEIALKYRQATMRLTYQAIPSYASRHSYMIFFALAKDKTERDTLLGQFAGRGIDAREPWMPIHMQPCFPELNKIQCPNAEDIFDRAFTLPIYNNMAPTDVAKVVDTMRDLLPP
jgi:perosamine synthetase